MWVIYQNKIISIHPTYDNIGTSFEDGWFSNILLGLIYNEWLGLKVDKWMWILFAGTRIGE